VPQTPPSPAARDFATTCRIGTRGSDLALWQAHTIQRLLGELGTQTEIEIIKTRGDRIDDVPLAQLEGKGFFTKELEDALLAGRVDLAVHSLKDLGTDMPDGLALAAMVGREDAREMLLVRREAVDEARLARGEALPIRDGARLGTSAARRQAQVKKLRPDVQIVDLRGNVPTRVNRLREERYDAILLACAGLKRLELKLDDLFTMPLDPAVFVPAPAQGMLGLQCRDEDIWKRTIAQLDCTEAARAVRAERTLLCRLEGGCQLPFGVNITGSGAQWRLEAFLARDVDDAAPLRLSLTGSEPEALAESAWSKLAMHRGL
jgi:hydroxymethylbilane synthase